MSRQFSEMPTLRQFIERARPFGVQRKYTPDLGNNPGHPIRFAYLQRKEGQAFAVIPDLSDDARLTPDVVRYFCRMLGLPPDDYGLAIED